MKDWQFTIFWALATVILVACTVTYEPETKSCMIHFNPSADQIKAVGEVCMTVIEKVHDEPAKIEFEDSGI